MGNGEYEGALRTICKIYFDLGYFAEDPINYWAKFLRKCIKNTLYGVIFVFCTRCEVFAF